MYKYRLVEQDEKDDNTNSKQDYDIIVTPLAASIDDAVKAFEKIDNYGEYISNLRNTKAEVEKAVTDHFGPSQPFTKKKLEKERGKPFPVKTKAAIDAFIKTLSTKPSLLKWKVVDDTLVFPTAGNPTKKTTEKIIDLVLNNAKIKYNLEHKETTVNEVKSNTHSIILTLNDISLKKFQTVPTFKNLLHPNHLDSLKIGDNKLTVNNTVWSTLQRMASPGGYLVKKPEIEEEISYKVYEALAKSCEILKEHFPTKNSFHSYLNENM